MLLYSKVIFFNSRAEIFDQFKEQVVVAKVHNFSVTSQLFYIREDLKNGYISINIA